MKKQLLILGLLFISLIAKAQSELKVFTEWTSTSGTQNFFYKNKVKTDASGNVYIAGATLNSSNNYDILVAKYNSSGVQQWIQQYNGAGNGDDMALGLFLGGTGSVYITGTVTTATSVDAVTIKYNSSGVQQWLTTYNGTGNAFDAGADIIEDGSYNVYITGSSYNASGNTDFITIKYNSGGTQQWVSRYDYTAQLNDAGIKIAFRNGNLNISGLAQTNSTTYRASTLTYNTSGTLIGTNFGTSSSSGIDQVNDMITDASGNIYIAGAIPVTGQGYNFDAIKLSSSLSLLWERTYNGNNSLNDVATGLKVDASGNVYISGTSLTSTEGKNIVTLKYNSSGTLQWSRTFNDAFNKDDEAHAMAIDASGNIYITGSVGTEADGTDYFTIKYDANGNIIWTIHNDGNAHLNDKATNIAIDNSGNIVVSGQSETAPGVYEYLTIKYVEKQVITPTDFNSETPSGSFSYYGNRGQIINTNDSLVPDIKYYSMNSSPALYIKEYSNSFVFAHIDTIASTNDTLQRIDLTYEKANSLAKTYPMEEKSDYLNYFLPQCPGGITKVHSNHRLITTNLYSNIDLMYSSNQNGIKYYYIVKPGGNPINIHFIFTGATSFYLDGTTNALTINSSVGSISFERPTVYQLDASNNIIPITGWTADWVVNGASNKYKFNIGAYDNTKPLIIQVDRGHSNAQQITANENLEWSTYFGGSSDFDNCIDVETNSTNNVWVGGVTLSPNFPLFPGNLTTQFNSRNCFIAKFDAITHPVWLTYYGGSAQDFFYELKIDNAENVYAVGSTTSSDFPNNVSVGINNPMHGAMDGFFIAFRHDGALILCDSYIGGSGGYYSWTYAWAIDVKECGNNKTIAIVGETNNANNFPVDNCTDAYNQTQMGGTSEGFIMRLDNNFNSVWCSLFGGSDEDGFSDVSIADNCESIVASGYTETTVTATQNNNTPCQPQTDGSFPDCPLSGAYNQLTFGGGDRDLMIVEFNDKNQLIWSTYFGGDKNDPAKLGCNANSNEPRICLNGGDLYLVSSIATDFALSFPTHQSNYPNAFNQTLQSTTTYNNNIIISRFNSDRIRTWCTLYGGNSSCNAPNQTMYAYDICNGPDNSIFITGTADADYVQTSNFCTVPSTYNEFPICNFSGINYMEVDAGTPNIDQQRSFIASFNKYDNLIWSTRFGTGNLNEEHGLAASQDKLFSVGYSNIIQTPTYTLYPFNLNDPLAYYQEFYNGIADGTISRFDISGITTAVDNNGIKPENTLNIFPNPANDYININFNYKTAGLIKIVIFDAIGKQIAVKENINSNQTIQFNISNLPSGIYFIMASNKKGTLYSTKFIKL